ncbi:DUF4340 domain-containing protein [Synechocystis sp. PCC 7509]|uniref:DUF4340 domain-containing protein n=1 Tax=Synechocystis sp. PCC 7509 TaxID=927677 RepID=UPI0002AC9E09|nr:DUF4340 domain-containing protein [Synechocystis sp. PCC 7509]
MKLPKTTLILLLLALGLGGFVYFYEIRGASQRQEAIAQSEEIFAFTEADVKAFAIKNQSQTLKFEQIDSRWQMKEPDDTPASNASIAFLLNLLETGKSNRTFSVPTTQLADYGLTEPSSAIAITLKNAETHQLILGKPDFNRTFLYALVDPPAKSKGNVNVLLVSPDFANAVNRQLSEWQSQDTKNQPTNPSP